MSEMTQKYVRGNNDKDFFKLYLNYYYFFAEHKFDKHSNTQENTNTIKYKCNYGDCRIISD